MSSTGRWFHHRDLELWPFWPQNLKRSSLCPVLHHCVGTRVRPDAVAVAADCGVGQFGDWKLIIINYLGLKLKIRHSAILENIASYVYAKFDDDQLWNEKALVLTTTPTTRTTLIALGDPFSPTFRV